MELKQATGISVVRSEHLLLIVPYGIETLDVLDGSPPCSSFNRTLWN